MLPFLSKKREASVAMPADIKVRESDHEESYDPMESAMEDFCHAEERKDYGAMADAFRAAFDLLEMQPHEEIEHEGEE